jgi:PAS domain S-box-containing protein
MNEPVRRKPEPSEPPLHFQPEWCRVTLASIGDAVITTDTQGRLTFLNAVAESLTGWTQQEAQGLILEEVFQIVNEETRNKVESPTIQALRDGIVVSLANHTLLIAKDGSERPIDDSAAPIRNDSGDIAGAVLVFRDVSERREQENSLSDALTYAQSIIATLREPFLALDKELRVRTANEAYYQTFQTSKEETEGHHFCDLEDGQWRAAGLHQKLINVVADHHPITDLEIAQSFPKLGQRVMVLNARRFVSKNNFPDLVLLAIEDVTERRQLERARMQAEMCADLHRRKDEFLAMLSHELRNPLAPIQNAIHILRLKTEDDPIQQQARTIIERQVGQMTALVNDLLEVSRITTGRIQIRQDHIVLQGVFERAVQSVRPLIDQRRHTLMLSVAEPPIWLNADAARLEQVLVNLLNNAAKYTKEGGRIWLTVEQTDQEAIIRVRDTGIGISPELLPRIFELFTQADRTLERSEGGLGIGLALVERLVVMHGGHVRASSTPGQGSEFIVQLPLAQAPTKESSPQSSQAEDAMAPRLRILIVDDNADAAKTLAVLLKANGHDAQTVFDGPSAIEAAREYRPHLILLDIGLPGMNGFEVAKKVRTDEDLQEVVLVALTGYGQESDKQLSQEAGFNHHLVKPADFNKIKQILETVQAGGS